MIANDSGQQNTLAIVWQLKFTIQIRLPCYCK